MPEPFNEAMHDFMLQIFGWWAEEESNRISDRVKLAVRIKDNQTYSYKGNKWGRKLAQMDVDEIIRLRREGLSHDKIARAVKYRDSKGKWKNPTYNTVRNILIKNGDAEIIKTSIPNS